MKKKEKEEAEKKKKMSFTFKQLQELNDVTKKDYIDKILEEDAQISLYIKRVHQKVEETEDQLVEQKMKIEDIKEDWKDEMDEINKNLLKKAVDNGIKRAEYQFIDMKIKDHDNDYLEDKQDHEKEMIQKYKDAQLNTNIDRYGQNVSIASNIGIKERQNRSKS